VILLAVSSLFFFCICHFIYGGWTVKTLQYGECCIFVVASVSVIYVQLSIVKNICVRFAAWNSGNFSKVVSFKSE